MKRLPRALFLGLAALLWAGAAIPAPTWENARQVTSAELVAAIRAQKDKGYAIEAIANSNRLLTGVFLELAERASMTDPERRPIRIGHEEYFDALLEAAGLSADSAPPHIRIPHEFGQDYLIDYRLENVIEKIEGGLTPLRALNVKGGWPSTPNAPTRYSYEDKGAQPHVEVTHQQVVAYRILDFGDVVVCDDIRGITGRVTSGVLGMVFAVLGKAHALHTRYVVAPDGVQLSRTGAKKMFTVTRTVAIYPDGRLLPDLPADRPDLMRLENVLKELDLKIRYVPLDMSPVPAPES
jgi:hypothetical protein